MTDRELVAKRLAQIETCVHDLQTLARPEQMKQEGDLLRFVQVVRGRL